MSLEERYFDKIVMLEVLEHLEHDEDVLRKLHSLLRKGGSLILSVPNDSWLHIFNPVKYFQHKRHYSHEMIQKLLEKVGFRIAHFNVTECWTLLANLYVHLFFKFFLRRRREFGLFKKRADQTYLQINTSGLDIILKAVKD